MDKKKQKIILCIVAVLLWIAVGVETFILYKKSFNKNTNDKPNQVENDNQQNNDNQVDDDKKEDSNDNQLDNNKEEDDNVQNNSQDDDRPDLDLETIYSKYPDIEWADTVASNSTNEFVRIENGKLVSDRDFEQGMIELFEQTINEIPKKITLWYSVGNGYYILTESGKVYFCAYFNEWEIKQVFENYNIVDMSKNPLDNYRIAGGNIDKSNYFLTSKGDLIDEDGYKYEDNNKNFVGYFSANDAMLYFDGSNHAYYQMDGKYYSLKDKKGNDIIYKKIYFSKEEKKFSGYGTAGKFIILDSNNDLYMAASENFEIRDIHNTLYNVSYIGKVDKIILEEKVASLDYNIIYLLSDGTEYSLTKVADYDENYNKKMVIAW